MSKYIAMFDRFHFKVRKVLDVDISEDMYLVKVFEERYRKHGFKMENIGWELVDSSKSHEDVATDIYYKWRDEQGEINKRYGFL